MFLVDYGLIFELLIDSGESLCIAAFRCWYSETMESRCRSLAAVWRRFRTSSSTLQGAFSRKAGFGPCCDETVVAKAFPAPCFLPVHSRTIPSTRCRR